MANAVILFFISFYILYEAYFRFKSPPEVASFPMMLIAMVGLNINLVGFWILRTGAKESLNVQGAFLEVISDALGSLGVIIAGIIMFFTDWYYADPIFSVLIGLFILPRTWKLLAQAVNVLLEGTPAHINVATVEQAMLKVDGVQAIHDLHIWTITSGVEALSAHAVLNDGADSVTATNILDKLNVILKQQFGIDHTTIQIEHSSRHDFETGH